MRLNQFERKIKKHFGFGSGLFTVIAGIYMAETVPADKLSLYGTSINTGIVVGLLVTNLV